jgi:hypothetical protein
MSSEKDLTPTGACKDAGPLEGAEHAPAPAAAPRLTAAKGNDTVDTLLEALGASDKPFMPRHKAESNGDVAAAYAAGPRTIGPGQKTRAPEPAVIVAHTVERVVPPGMPLDAGGATEPGHRGAMARNAAAHAAGGATGAAGAARAPVDTMPSGAPAASAAANVAPSGASVARSSAPTERIRRQADTVPALHVQARQEALTNRRLVLAALAVCALVLVIGLARFALRNRGGEGALEASADSSAARVTPTPSDLTPHGTAPAANPIEPPHPPVEARSADHATHAGAVTGPASGTGAAGVRGGTVTTDPSPALPSTTAPKGAAAAPTPVAPSPPATTNAAPQRPAERVRSGLERGGSDRPYEAPKAPQLPQTRVDLLEDDIRKDDIRK